MDDNGKLQPFPTTGIMPKEETGASAFIAAHPEYDGRGTVVAILDTGVDPGAIGLQTTSDGKPKVIDVIDCSGSGDVDTSTVVKGEEKDGFVEIQGLSGRALRLNPAWANPTGEWRVGLKRLYELVPRGLPGRLREERRKPWDKEMRALEAAARADLEAWDAAHPAPAPADARGRQNLQDLLDQVLAADKAYDDPGPIYDCVVFHDGQVWRAALDTKEDGDLTAAAALADYRLERQFAAFGDRDRLNYAVNVYDGGAVLSVVCDAGAHGTHVAGIVAGHHPGRPDLDGVAPGAQIVSLKIGDTRLGSMETGPGLVRAMIDAHRLKPDILNMSYGEASSTGSTGRLMEFFEQGVYRDGLIFLSSAMNEGPGLSTLGCPGGTSSALIGVAAYCSPAMMAAGYSMRQTVPSTNYTWSSVGPTLDGDAGVSLIAPGGAIAPVPNWTLQKSQLMNGTSMSSPNAAGNVALLLSALKAEGRPYTPMAVRRWLESSCVPLPGVHPLVQGRGLLRVDAAYEFALGAAEATAPEGLWEHVRYEVAVNGKRGLYLRQPEEVSKVTQHPANVNPKFHEDAPNSDKIGFEMRVALACDEPWVEIPGHMLMVHGGKGFAFSVDPRGLPPGLHHTRIRGFNADAPGRGAVFEIPITIIKPFQPTEPDFPLNGGAPLTFEPATLHRHFIVPPEGAMWADITIEDLRPAQCETKEDDTNKTLALHVLQLMPHQPYRDNEFKKFVSIGAGETLVLSCRVVPGVTAEVSVAQWWASLGASAARVAVGFRGVRPCPDKLALSAGSGFEHVTLTALLRKEEVAPAAVLDKWQQKLAPTSAKVSPLGERDVTPAGKKIYQLVLEYAFDQEEEGDVTPRLGLLNGVLYEAALENQFYLVFDKDKKLLGSGDAWPGAVKVPKGEGHVVRYQVRHDDAALLRGLRARLVLALERTCSVPLAAYASRERLTAGGGAFKARALKRGASCAVFLAEPAADKLPKGCKPGDLLLGTCSYCKADAALPGAGKRPGGFPVSYAVGPRAKDFDKRDPPKVEAPDDRTEEQKVEDAVRDLKLERLSKLEGKPAFEGLYARFLAEHPGHLPLLRALVRHRGALAPPPHAGVIEAVDAIIPLIDETSLAQWMGVNHDLEDPLVVKEKKDMDEKKEILVDCLARKAEATAALYEEGTMTADDLKIALAGLARWDTVEQDKYAKVRLASARARGRAGEELALLASLLAKGGTKEVPPAELHAARARAYERRGWACLVEHERKWALLAKPKGYALF